MTIIDIRNAFRADTKIYICSYDNPENRLKMNNRLYGNAALSQQVILPKSISVIDNNSILIQLDMPESVLNAWKSYSENE